MNIWRYIYHFEYVQFEIFVLFISLDFKSFAFKIKILTCCENIKDSENYDRNYNLIFYSVTIFYTSSNMKFIFFSNLEKKIADIKKGNNDKKRLKCSKTEKLLNKFSFQLTAGISLSYYMSVYYCKNCF